jgi:hypothetical protein
MSPFNQAAQPRPGILGHSSSMIRRRCSSSSDLPTLPRWALAYRPNYAEFKIMLNISHVNSHVNPCQPEIHWFEFCDFLPPCRSSIRRQHDFSDESQA